MVDTHTEFVLHKLTKPDLVQLLLYTEANMGAQISTLTSLTCSYRLSQLISDPNHTLQNPSSCTDLVLQISQIL